MPIRCMRANKSFTNSYGHHPLVNLEMWDSVPADQTQPNGEIHTFRQIDNLQSDGITAGGNYHWPVSSACSVDLGTGGAADTYFDMFSNPVTLQQQT